ncbi:MAG TPA: CHAP domain-containing protein [Nocardioides sp.]|nr:CHAP domain-containing protein [Nocardioides sp.]
MHSTRRLTCSLLLAVLAALLPLTPPAAQASSTYLCTGYAGCHEDGYSHFGYRTAGRHMWWQMYSGHNCTNYVAYRLVRGGMSATRPWSGSGNADNWGRVKSRITNGTPMVGAVAWWRRNVPGAGSNGHVAYVEKVISRTRIVISEDSWSGDFHWRRISKAGSGWPTGFIHFHDRKVAVQSRPEVSGRAAVGEQLVATAGQWSVSSRHTFQWLLDGKPIRGATSSRFTPGPGQLRGRLSVRVTASHRGYLEGAATSVQTARVERGDLKPVAHPAIAGKSRVGEVLSVGGAAWSPRPDSTSIRWFAGQEPIAGERGTRLRLAPALLGKPITARVRAHKDGYRGSTLVSPVTTRVALGRFEITDPFRVHGNPKLGGRLEVERGTFRPAEATVTYLWLRNGQPISGAVGSSYVPGLRDVGQRLSVQAHLSREGYQDRTVRVSADGRVTTRPTLSVWTEGRPGRAIVRLKVTAPGVSTPGGRATVRIGDHRATGRLRDGRLRVVIGDLNAGVRTVRVSYAGTDIVSPEKLVTTVRVRRR